MLMFSTFTIYFRVDYCVLRLLWINEGMTCWDCCQQSVGNHAPYIAPFLTLTAEGVYMPGKAKRSLAYV